MSIIILSSPSGDSQSLCGGCTILATYLYVPSSSYYVLSNFDETYMTLTNGACEDDRVGGLNTFTSFLSVSAPSPLPVDFSSQLSASFVSFAGYSTCSISVEGIVAQDFGPLTVGSTTSTSSTTSSITSSQTSTTQQPSTTSITAPTAAPAFSQKRLSTGAKAGIGLGVSLAVLLLVGSLIFCFFYRRKRAAQRRERELPSEKGLDDGDQQQVVVGFSTKAELGSDERGELRGISSRLPELDTAGQRYELEAAFHAGELRGDEAARELRGDEAAKEMNTH